MFRGLSLFQHLVSSFSIGFLNYPSLLLDYEIFKARTWILHVLELVFSLIFLNSNSSVTITVECMTECVHQEWRKTLGPANFMG